MNARLLKSLLFIGLTITNIAILSYIGNAINPDRSYRRSYLLIRHVLKNADDVHALSIGSSSGCALKLDMVSSNGYYLWAPATDMLETNKLLHYVVPRLPNLKEVYCAVSYTAFYRDNRLAVESDLPKRRRNFYAATPSWELITLSDLNLYFKGKLFSFCRLDHWKSVFFTLLGVEHFYCNMREKTMANLDPRSLPEKFIFKILVPNKQAKKIVRKVRNQQDLIKTMDISPDEKDQLLSKIKVYQDRRLTYELRKVALENKIPHHMRVVSEVHRKRPTIQEDTFKIFEDTIIFLQDRDIQVVFYTPPYFYPFTRFYNPYFIQTMKENMAVLQKKYDIEYYDFSRAKMIIHDGTLFANQDHLNLRGAEIFTRLLKQRRADKVSLE